MAPTARPRWRAPALVGAVAVAAGAAGCGSSGAGTTDARGQLQQAKHLLDATDAVHFTLTSTGAQATGTNVTGGTGDFARPDKFQGKLDVLVNGLPLRIQAVSSGGTFWAQLPFQSSYTQVDPTQYGFADPAQLISRNGGLTSLLTSATAARSTGQERLQGELLDDVDVVLPGASVKQMLTDADPSEPVKGRVSIDPSTHQVRKVVMTGPFYAAHADSTFTLLLDRYGEQVSIVPPR